MPEFPVEEVPARSKSIRIRGTGTIGGTNALAGLAVEVYVEGDLRWTGTLSQVLGYDMVGKHANANVGIEIDSIEAD